MAKILDALENEYFEWMCKLVYDEKYFKHRSYQKLLTYLNNREFVYILDMDGNRAEDGIDLRYRFGYENHCDYPIIAHYLDVRPCSILEMMVALAFRCEEHIMGDPDIGDRTGQWFWGMVASLGLENMDDVGFDERYADGIIERFLNREYKRDGKGGLFTVKHSHRDLSSIEIWYQMHSYLNQL